MTNIKYYIERYDKYNIEELAEFITEEIEVTDHQAIEIVTLYADDLLDIDDTIKVLKKCELKNKQLDNMAYEKSHGDFRNFEDYMRDKGATIAEDWEPLRRES